MKKGIVLILTIIISFSTVSGIKAADINSSQKKLDNVKESINQKKDQLNTINQNRNSTEEELKKINDEMGSVSNQVNTLNQQTEKLNNQIEKAEEELNIRKKMVQEENQLFNRRIRALYNTGSVGYLEFLLDSKSFNEFLFKIDCLRRIATYDRNLLQSLKNSKNLVEIKKAELENKKADVIQVNKKKEGYYALLKEKSKSKSEIMVSLEKDKATYEKMIAQEELESLNIANMIRQMKIAEEEARKKAEEEKKKAGTATGNTKKSNVKSGDRKVYCITGTVYDITSDYGYRVHPVLGGKKFHSGIDIGVPLGTPVYSLKDGVVVYAGEMSGYGNVVMINHGDIVSLYAHNTSLVVKVGQAVKGGQLISYSGNTGISSGPHLHFEIRTANGNTVDPNPYYAK